MKKWEVDEIRQCAKENGDKSLANMTDREIEAIATENYGGDGHTTESIISQRGYIARALGHKNHN